MPSFPLISGRNVHRIPHDALVLPPDRRPVCLYGSPGPKCVPTFAGSPAQPQATVFNRLPGFVFIPSASPGISTGADIGSRNSEITLFPAIQPTAGHSKPITRKHTAVSFTGRLHQPAASGAHRFFSIFRRPAEATFYGDKNILPLFPIFSSIYQKPYLYFARPHAIIPPGRKHPLADRPA